MKSVNQVKSEKTETVNKREIRVTVYEPDNSTNNLQLKINEIYDILTKSTKEGVANVA